MMTITQLESAVLEAICAAHGASLPALPAFLSDPVVIERRNTGHGFYTDFRPAYFDVARAWPQPIEGPIARMVDMGEDASMGFLLWCSADKATLEGFQYGDAKGNSVDLKTWSLADLRFSQLRWE